jgi:hypothetical protein
MKRSLLLALIRVAAYHDDRATMTRLLIEHRISRPAFDAEVQRGREMRKAGIKCTCKDCNP